LPLLVHSTMHLPFEEAAPHVLRYINCPDAILPQLVKLFNKWLNIEVKCFTANQFFAWNYH
jgi:hypothetical protein